MKGNSNNYNKDEIDFLDDLGKQWRLNQKAWGHVPPTFTNDCERAPCGKQ